MRTVLLLIFATALLPAADLDLGLGPQPVSAGKSADTSAVNGTTLGTTSATAGKALIGTGTTIASVTLAKDASIDGGGNVTLANNATARSDLGLGSAATLTAGAASGAATLDSNSLLTFTQVPTVRRLVASDCSSHAVSTGTSETVLKTFSFTAANLPTLSANTNIIIHTLWTITGSTNNKTMNVRLGAAGAGTGGTLVMNNIINTASQVTLARDIVIFVRATNSQIFYVAGATQHEGPQSNAVPTAAIDLTSNWEITETGTTASSGETINLQASSVEIQTP